MMPAAPATHIEALRRYGTISFEQAATLPTVFLTAYTVMISRRLATFMEALASERMTWSEKKEAFRQIWFSAKSAKGKRIAPGEVPAQPRPPAGEPAHSAD